MDDLSISTKSTFFVEAQLLVCMGSFGHPKIYYFYLYQ